MSRSSSQDQTNIPLIVTTNESGTGRPNSAAATSLDSSFKAKSCRSFTRQSKLNNDQHRNKSVPQNLQVLSQKCPNIKKEEIFIFLWQ